MEKHGKRMVKTYKKHGKTMQKHGKRHGKPWKNMETNMENT